ncbi:MAG: site-2 protease family protein [Vicinamibacterales bacterium]
MAPVPDTPPAGLPEFYTWAPRPKFRDRRWLHLLLLLATIGTTTFVGGMHYASFVSDFGSTDVPLTTVQLLVSGLWYSATVLTILGCHELGHYLACRYYDVDASLPFFIPFLIPIPIFQTGTFGAFIRIREPIPSKRMLFDIGIAGPIAGFIIAVPAMFIGMAMSNVLPVPQMMDGINLGEPLLLKLAARLLLGTPPAGYDVNLHPMTVGAWFGLIATSLNLFPIGQLDGGHISYAVLGRKSSHVTLVMIGCALVLTWFSPSWMVWTGLMVVMLFVFGRHHPRTFDEEVPLDSRRKWLALFAVVMFILCFTPAPIQPLVGAP